VYPLKFFSAVDFTLATPRKCYMEAFDGVGSGDFSQSLVRHKAVTTGIQKREPLEWNASVTDDAGQLVSYSLLW